METKNRTRVIMYDVSTGKPKFYCACTLPEGVKDASTIVYNSTIGLFPLIEGRDINMVIHGNSIIASHVESNNGVITKINPLITCITESVEIYPNGNVFYRETNIIRFGEVGITDKYLYGIHKNMCRDVASLECFNNLDEACDFIDKNRSM